MVAKALAQYVLESYTDRQTDQWAYLVLYALCPRPAFSDPGSFCFYHDRLNGSSSSGEISCENLSWSVF